MSQTGETTPIRVLPGEVVAKIAAGEVVERPASVVKELVENAIDAGANDVRVEVRGGGRRLIRVADDGCGIPADEVELAFARHATSKLAQAADLFRIGSLGFRGEALASIAAVSQLTMVTRPATQDVGTLIRLEGGRLVAREGKGCPAGTVVTVENLFFNVPARLKFLRTESTEASHVSQLVTRYALALPDRRFTLVNNGRLTFQSTGSGQLYDAIIKVFGLQTAQQMLKLETGDEPPIAVSGYVGAPSLHRANRNHLTFFVNHRWIQDRSLAYAVTQAYHTLLPTGRYPLVVLSIELDPAEVDVNVHPTKREIKFRRPNEVFAAVQKAVRRTLADQAPVPDVSDSALAWAAGRRERRERLVQAGHERRSFGQLGLELQRTADVEPRPPAGGPHPPAGLPMLRVLGQIGQTYIIAEGPEGLYLIDQHAAHERVLYERLLAERAEQAVPSQQLLEPLPLELEPRQSTLLAEHREALHALGFEIEPFGGNTFLLRAVPVILKETDLSAAVGAIIDELEAGGTPLAEEVERRLAASVCKQGAVKAGQTLALEEMRNLVRQLERTTRPRTCPHGRPTMVHLSAAQLAREFGRDNS